MSGLDEQKLIYCPICAEDKLKNNFWILVKNTNDFAYLDIEPFEITCALTGNRKKVPFIWQREMGRSDPSDYKLEEKDLYVKCSNDNTHIFYPSSQVYEVVLGIARRAIQLGDVAWE